MGRADASPCTRTRSHISGVRHGTPLYIAPEILRSGTASRSADVYSFGVMLWELFHGMSAWSHLMMVCVLCTCVCVRVSMLLHLTVASRLSCLVRLKRAVRASLL